MRREHQLKAKLVELLRAAEPSWMVFPIEDRFRHGVPDLAVIGAGTTTWWETKHAAPEFDSEGIQELTMKRLARHSHARYIIWRETTEVTETLIVHPRRMNEWTMSPDRIPGINHRWLVQEIRKAHHDPFRP